MKLGTLPYSRFFSASRTFLTHSAGAYHLWGEKLTIKEGWGCGACKGLHREFWT